MLQSGWTPIKQRWVGYAVSLASVAAVSVVIGIVSAWVRISNISMLDLIPVLVVAAAYGRGPAILAAVSAFLAFDWFFILPYHTFTVNDPSEWLALILLLVTGTVTAELAARQRVRANEAEQREHEVRLMYDVARLMHEPSLASTLQAVAERLWHELSLTAVAIEIDDGDATATATAGDTAALQSARNTLRKPTHLMRQGAPPTAVQTSGPVRWVKVMPPHLRSAPIVVGADRIQMAPIRIESKDVGSILVVRPAEAMAFGVAESRLLSAVAVQLGLSVERARLRREAMEAEILRRTDELKNALLNAVSHDLRTPLASIVASASSLRRQDIAWTAEDKQEFATAIEEEALRLNQIVGNLLDLSRVEGGTLRPEKGWYDLGELIDGVLDRLRPLLAQHRVTVDVPDDLPPVLLDYVEIDQVLSNLLENAAKYTPPGTEIALSARREGNLLAVEVADRGPGCPPEALPRLFDPFYRVDKRGPRPAGTGLGLAVAKGLVEAHGGRIWAENRADGGARFVFTVPVGAKQPAGVAQETAE